ncbi:hypothetical protein HanHA89_Chr03g0121641 [Helianthus annuus]|nr:hypothetical protein HanHA89_Chr03g0121641 [Helianthus annuus]
MMRLGQLTVRITSRLRSELVFGVYWFSFGWFKNASDSIQARQNSGLVRVRCSSQRSVNISQQRSTVVNDN